MGKWRTVKIGELGEVFDGPHATPKTVFKGPIFLGIGALQDGRINLGETRHVTLEDFKKWTRRVLPQAGDVVFSYETRLGQAAIIPEGMVCCLGRRMGLVRVDRTKILPRFFLYNYLSPDFQEFLHSRTVHGATVDRILLTEFPDFPVPCPPIEQQHTIAHILGTLDDKIEVNRRMNATLEAMARAVFKDWFVDFGPTRTRMEGRKPYLAPEIWDLFPDNLDDEGKPVGWTTASIEALASRIAMGPFGSRIKKENFVESGVPVIRGKNLADGFIDQDFVFVTKEKADELGNSKARPGDIVFTHRGALGKWRIVEADPWDRDYLDPVEPASLTFEGDGHGEFAFGGVQGGLDREYSRRIIFFTWQGFDEMDEAGGDGAAELDDDGSLEIESVTVSATRQS